MNKAVLLDLDDTLLPLLLTPAQPYINSLLTVYQYNCQLTFTRIRCMIRW